MNKTVFVLICLVSVFFLKHDARATHAAGAELIYEYVNDSTYRLFFKLYRDCTGSTVNSWEAVCATNTCDTTTRQTVLNAVTTLPDGRPNGSEVSRGCSGFPTTCTSLSSTLPGYQEWWYTG